MQIIHMSSHFKLFIDLLISFLFYKGLALSLQKITKKCLIGLTDARSKQGWPQRRDKVFTEIVIRW